MIYSPNLCSKIPRKISIREVFTSLERIVFAKYFWQRLVLSQHSTDRCSNFRHSVNLSCCWLGHFASESFLKELVCLTRFASCHRNLLIVLVNEHMSVCWTTVALHRLSSSHKKPFVKTPGPCCLIAQVLHHWHGTILLYNNDIWDYVL